MRKFTILVDMDDTLESLLPAWVQWLNTHHGLSVDVESIAEWDMRVSFPSLTAEEINAPLFIREFWETVLPKPGAVECVKRLIDDGHEVYICTASNYKTLTDKMEVVLFRHFPYLKWENVIVSYNKHLIKGDFIIDDAPHNLENTPRFSLPILMDAPHNRDADSNAFYRVHDWYEIYKLITNKAMVSRTN